MEVFNDEKIEVISKELERLKNAIGHFEEENERSLTIKPILDEKNRLPKLNYGLNERKYDYEKITKFEKLGETQKNAVAPKIDKNWLAANMDAPDVMNFYSEIEMYKPSSKFNKDFGNYKNNLNGNFEEFVKTIEVNDDLHQLNSCEFEYLD